MTRKRGGRRRGGKRGEKAPQQEEQPAVPEQPFCLLKDLPAPVMRQLVQQHLSGDDCVTLLGTCRHLARTVVQHRTQPPPQSRALHWNWRARDESTGSVSSTMATPQVATAARLLAEWAPAELHVSLSGTAEYSLHGAGTPGTPTSLPVALLPLITTLTLTCMQVTPLTMEALQQCQRLHTLDVDECWFSDILDWVHSQMHEASRASGGASLELPLCNLRLRPSHPLPELRSLRVSHNPAFLVPSWATESVAALCARAATVRGAVLLNSLISLSWNPDAGANSSFPEVAEWDLEGEELSQERLKALLQLPGLRRVAADRLDLHHDARDAACAWETLTLRRLAGAERLLRLPSSLGHVVVTERLSPEELGSGSSEEAEQQMERLWWGPGRLRVQVDMPPSEQNANGWCLDDESRQAGYFSLGVAGDDGAVPLRQLHAVLPPGGGPRTLQLDVTAAGAAAALRQLAPALAASRVRTLCIKLLYYSVGDDERSARLGGALCALPDSVACVRLRMAHPELQSSLTVAEEILVGPAVRHPLTIVLQFRVLGGDGLSHAQESRLRDLCAQRQPSMQLEILERYCHTFQSLYE